MDSSSGDEKEVEGESVCKLEVCSVCRERELSKTLGNRAVCFTAGCTLGFSVPGHRQPCRSHAHLILRADYGAYNRSLDLSNRNRRSQRSLPTT
jgi:hypothetical protein